MKIEKRKRKSRPKHKALENSYIYIRSRKIVGSLYNPKKYLTHPATLYIYPESDQIQRWSINIISELQLPNPYFQTLPGFVNEALFSTLNVFPHRQKSQAPRYYISIFMAD